MKNRLPHKRGSEMERKEGVVIDQMVRSRRRTVSLVITEDARLVVRAPAGMPMEEIQALLGQKADWIKRHRTRMRHRTDSAPIRKYEAEEEFLWMGQILQLRPMAGMAVAARDGDVLLVPDSGSVFIQEAVFRWYREEAGRILKDRVHLWSERMRLSHDRLTITQAKKRWGSCGGRANLSFPARLIMAPLEVVDYVVIHELAHVLHKHHGPLFWAVVSSFMPDYARHRKWLEENAHRMVM